jgi:hypothetical protein
LKSILKAILFVLIWTAANISILPQSDYLVSTVTDTIPINLKNNYSISAVSIVPLSETIRLRNSDLKRFVDYQVLYTKGTFTLSDTLPYSVFDTLFVTYKSVDVGLKKMYRKRSLVVKYDEKLGDTVRVAQNEGSGFSPDEIFGPGIEKSGTLIRGFTVGTTKDFSLNSGLRLQLSGNLTNDIEIVAALTDQNTPIQPEGNTERLEELDKVFIQIKHKNATGTFGDYQLDQRNGEFGVINRKLQGLMGTYSFDNYNGYVAIAGSRGKFNSNNITGTDGVQGPYQLTGLTGEKNIIVLAGTEKVFLDGIEMTRGENNDYIIEYANATITFTTKRLITNASRISVDFEYTDRRYSRNFLGAGSNSAFFNNKLKLGLQFLQEGDDPNAPIDFSLSDEDKQILKDAGDDPLKAVKSGVSLAVPDSLGNVKGIYRSVDTLINNTPYTYYIYNPGDSTSLYNVSFSYVGDGKGDYRRESLGNYTFVGINAGSYNPVIFIPVPQEKELANMTLSINPFENVQLNLEYAGSLWDKNKLSPNNEGDNYGFATNINLQILPSEINIGKISLGKMGASYKDRFVQKRFTSTDRFNEVEFDRLYNTTGSNQNQDETFREFKVNFLPVNELNLTSSAGFLKRGDDFRSDRYNNIIRISDNDNYNISYNLDYVNSRNVLIKSNWFRHAGDAFYKFWKLKPGLNILAEDRVDKQSPKDSLLTGSLIYHEFDPYIRLLDLEGFAFTFKYSFRDDYLPIKGIMEKESDSHSQGYEISYKGIDEVNSTLNLTLWDRKYSEKFVQTGSLNTEQILIRSQTKFRFWEKILNGDLYYEVSTKKQPRQEKVFIRVEQGTGNYKYLGDLNNNGIADENEFQSTIYDGDYIQLTLPTDELFPVIDLKTSTRWKINYEDIFDKKTFIGTILAPISTETFWRVEEITKETVLSRIYLLNFKYFQRDSVTIRGSNYIQQDFFINENRQDLSFRFRFTQQTSLNDFNTGVQRGYNRERSLRIRFRMIKEVSNQTDLVNTTDNLSAPVSSLQSRQITDNSITTDFSYRPYNSVEVGLKFKAGRSEDKYPETPTVIDLNSQSIRFNLSFVGTGRLRIEVERTELISNNSENYIPFELTGGNQLGKNYYWRLNFDYRIASFLQTTVGYDGRWQGHGRVIHTARAEARAYF